MYFYDNTLKMIAQLYIEQTAIQFEKLHLGQNIHLFVLSKS
jgi:hypothetical protein